MAGLFQRTGYFYRHDCFTVAWLRTESGNIIIDPVIPHSLDGLSASMDFMGHSVTFRYAMKEDSFGPKTITVNDKPVKFTYERNKYRQGGAVIPTDQFLAMLNQQDNTVEILM